MSIDARIDPQPALLVAPLAHFKSTDLALAGGKGANLGELLHAGFAVPPGFVITTAAYDLLLQTGVLQARLNDLLASLATTDPSTLAQVCRRMSQAFASVSFPSSLASQIVDAYRRLGGAVAVRSSATAEDLPGAAFAGQQETFLNIIGELALLEAVRGCWASLWSERAVLYRLRQNLDQTNVKLAVVVQQMVPANVAGVMFTAHPVTGARDQLVIDASPGLGEAVVSGLVTPDHFVLDKRSRRLKIHSLGRREVIFRPRAGGGTEQITPASVDPPAAVLPPSVVRQLARLGAAIERHYAAPQDIEWAWIMDPVKTGKLFILQARPMTALPEPLKISAPMRLVIPMLAEMWPVRPYPLDLTTFTGALERAVGNFLVVLIGKSAPDPDKALVEDDGVVVRFEPPEVHPSPGMLIASLRTFWRTRHADPARWQADPLLAEVITHARRLEALDLPALTWSQNIETMHELLALIPRVMQLREHYFPQALLGLGSLWLLLALARRRACLSALLGGVETKTTETNRLLETLATQIRTDPLLQDIFARSPSAGLQPALQESQPGRDFLERFAAFLSEYGHREIALTISQGAWRDRPEIVLDLLKVMAATPAPQADSYQAWKRTRDDLLAHSLLGARPVRRLFLRALLNARCLIQIREDTHFYATLVLPSLRQVALELGRRLERLGGLVSASDVLHLRLEELETLGEPWPPAKATLAQIRLLVARRQAKRQSLASSPLIDPRLLAVESRARPGEAVLLNGTPGSPGLAGGPARVICDASEFGKLQPGDVLVAPVTNPAWTPLFLHAAAVVVDTGGSASHAAIVAREYGIPAVMGTLNGTQQLVDGQYIQVDGSRGLVLKGENPHGDS